MNKKTKAIIGYASGALVLLLGIIPFWSSCMDYCSASGSINPGFVALGLSILAFQALELSKIEQKPKAGCGLMLLSVMGPLTFLGFAFAANGWYVIAFAAPALFVGIALLIAGIIKYAKSS